jgi:hypothetical protein
MSKFLKLSIVALILMGLMAGSAFAGVVSSSSSAANTPYTISLETLGATRSIILGGYVAAANDPGAANYALAYTSSQNLTAQNLLTVTLAGAAYNGATVNVCAMNGSDAWRTTVATGAPAANATTFNFQLNSGLGAGNFVIFTTNACGAANKGDLGLVVTPGTVAGYETATVTAITAGGISVDPAAAGNIVKAQAEYVATIAAANHTVDYLSTPFNGTLLLAPQAPLGPEAFAASNGNLAVAGTSAANVTRTAHQFNVDNGANNANLTTSLVLALNDTAAWQGVSKVFLSNTAGAGAGFNAKCADTAASNTVGTGSPSGTVTLTTPAAGFNGVNSVDYDVCVVVNGTSTLNTRTISGTLTPTVTGTGAQSSATVSGNVDTWNLNAYQAVIPWVTNTSVVPTYCLINNGNTQPSSSTLTLTVLSSEGAVAGLSNLPIGSIAAQQSMLIIFNNNGITTGTGTVLASVSSMGTDDRYSALLTVAAAGSGVTVACEQTDPVTGGKRNVPVLDAVGVVTPNF